MAQWHGVLEAVIRERRPALVGYACLFAANRLDAEDLVQDALVRTFAKARTIDDPHAAEGYVRQAIRTSFLDSTRRRSTWNAKAHLFRPPGETRGPEEAVTAGLDVRAALGALTPRERACVVLRFFDDLPVAEVAAELRIADGAVKRYLSDATAKLRLSLDAHDGSLVESADERAGITFLTGGRTS